MANSFSDDIYYMTGSRPNIYWKACWLVISPVMLTVVLVAYVVIQAQKHPTYPAWNPNYVSGFIFYCALLLDFTVTGNYFMSAVLACFQQR